MPRKAPNFHGVILCGCGDAADFATFFFNGEETEISCTKCHVIAVLAMMEKMNAERQAELEGEEAAVGPAVGDGLADDTRSVQRYGVVR